MLDRIWKVFAVGLIGCLILPGCAYMSKSGRQQMAYQRYVKKSIHRRNKGKMKITKEQRRIPDYEPSKYKVSAGVENAPESVTSGGSPGEQ